MVARAISKHGGAPYPPRIKRVELPWTSQPVAEYLAERAQARGKQLIVYDTWTANAKPIALTAGSKRAQKFDSPVALLSEHTLFERSRRFYDNLVEASLPAGQKVVVTNPPLVPKTPFMHPFVLGTLTLLRTDNKKGVPAFLCTLRHESTSADGLPAAVTLQFMPPIGRNNSPRTRLIAAVGTLPGIAHQLTNIAKLLQLDFPDRLTPSKGKSKSDGWQLADTAGGPASPEAAFYRLYRYPGTDDGTPRAQVMRSWALPELPRRRNTTPKIS